MSKVSSHAATVLTAVILAAGFMYGCGDKAKKDFDLTIVVSAPIGDIKTDKLPQTIINLCLPMTGYSDFHLVPRPILHRLGAERGSDKSLETRISGGVAGNTGNVQFLERAVRKHLSTVEIGEAFSRVNDPTLDLKSFFTSFLRSIPKHAVTIFVTSEVPSKDFSDIKTVESIDSARALMAQQIRENQVVSFVVFLDPPVAYGDEQNNNHDDSLRILEDSLRILAEANKSASGLADSAARKKALEDVAERIGRSNNPSDYRFTYEMVKNCIYGKRHEEAFDTLRKAAEIAIDHGQTGYMLDRLDGDKDTDLWKLAHGHGAEWDLIIEALEHKNKKLLSGSDHQSSTHHGH